MSSVIMSVVTYRFSFFSVIIIILASRAINWKTFRGSLGEQQRFPTRLRSIVSESCYQNAVWCPHQVTSPSESFVVF